MIKEFLANKLTDKQKELIEWNSTTTQHLLSQLDKSVVTQEYGIGLPYWSKQNPLLVKNFTWLMAQLKFGTIEITSKYSRFNFDMTLLDTADILAYRARKKLENMSLRFDDQEYSSNLVKRPFGIANDGIPRPAMMRASKLPFQLDRSMLAKYRRPITQNLIKSIKKGIEQGHISDKFFADHASYLEITNLLMDKYINEDLVYNSECNVQDQRGRAIKKTLKRIGNYISSKDFRASLIVPKSYAITVSRDNIEQMNDIYLFIAELTGHKCLGQTIYKKALAGRQAYLDRELPKLNLKSAEDRKDLHELIWLERIYKLLDGLYSRFNTSGTVLWDIPLEIDHTMLT